MFSAERDTIINQVFVSIYNENYTRAHSEISIYKTELGAFYSDILTIDLLWWEFVRSKQSNETQKKFISFLNQFDNRYEDDSELKLRQLIKNSYLIRYEFKRYNIIGAINTRTKLKELLDEITSEKLLYPQNRMKLLGLYTTLFQYFDNLINPFFSKSKRELRSKALKQVEFYTHDKDIIVRTLSLYFLGRIEMNIENEKDAGIQCFIRLSEYYPDNTFFKEILSKYD